MICDCLNHANVLPLAPQNHPPSNILILLHGLGDTNIPFTQFARAMALPDTCAISIRAPAPMPFDLTGSHWGDDIIFDNSSVNGGPDIDAGFTKSTKLVLEDIIQKVLINKKGYTMRDIVLFGFMQGGMLALNIAASLNQELGGVVSIGAGLPSHATRVPVIAETKLANRTPILVCKARDGSGVSMEDEDSVKKVFAFTTIKEWPKRGDGMPRNRDEMLPIMQFFARRLRSQRGVPAGAVEVT